MQIGKRNRKVQLQARAAGEDDLGQPNGAWETFASPWANVVHQSGFEAIKAGAETSVVKASINVRYRTGLTTGIRVVLGATTYEVKAVLPDEQDKRFVNLACEVVT